MKHVLITGGAGFVGRHFTEYFLKQGDLVYCVDKLAKGTGRLDPTQWYFNPDSYKTFLFYKEDCRSFFKRKNLPLFDYVFHLAAMVGGRIMIEHNPLAVADDLSIDSEFWQWVIKAKPRKVVSFSSSAAYPISYQRKDSYVLLKEGMISFNDNIGMPDMTYGWAKLTNEYLGLLAYQQYGIHSVVYRPFSGYGEDQDLTYPFPSIMNRIKKVKNEIIEIWGSGEQKRDFIHIDDCLRGVIETMDKINDGSPLNLSTGRVTSFIDLVKLAGNVLNRNLTAHPLSSQPEGVYARGGDTAKQRQLGFIPKISLEEGIKRMLWSK